MYVYINGFQWEVLEDYLKIFFKWIFKENLLYLKIVLSTENMSGTT